MTQTIELFDPISPSMLHDPYEVYRRMRRDSPVHRHDQLGAYVVTRYEDCARVLSDAETFISDYRKIGEHIPEEVLQVQTLDAPDHGLVRRVIMQGLKTVDVSAWTAAMVQDARSRLDALCGLPFNFVSDFNEPFARSCMASLFGVQGLGEPGVFEAAQRALVLSMDAGLEPSRGEPGTAARNYMSDLIEPYSRTPPPSGLLAEIDFELEPQMHRYVVNACRAVFVAGILSTSSMMSCALPVLMKAQIKGVLTGGIDQNKYQEVIRHSGAVQVETRATIHDVLIGDTLIDAGSEVLACIASANRDETVFSDPDSLNWARNGPNHLGFGRGVHSCVGAHLAAPLSAQVFDHLFRTYNIKTDGPSVVRPTGTLRGYDQLPITLTRKARA